MVYKSLGQYPKALEYFEKSLAIRQKLGDVQGEGVTLNNIAKFILLGSVSEGIGIL